jgi:hypothetical protein
MKRLLIILILFSGFTFAQYSNDRGTNADSFRISKLGYGIRWSNTKHKYFTKKGTDTTWFSSTSGSTIDTTKISYLAKNETYTGIKTFNTSLQLESVSDPLLAKRFFNSSGLLYWRPLAHPGPVYEILTDGGSYSNPAWITSLAFSKLSSKPTTIAGYGITDGVTTAVTSDSNKVPLWGNGKKLNSGLAYTSLATASTVAARDGSGNIWFNNVTASNIITAEYQYRLGKSGVSGGSLIYYTSSAGQTELTSTPVAADKLIYLPGISGTLLIDGGSYSNPAWLTGLAWSKISTTPTTIAGYGITDVVTPTYGNMKATNTTTTLTTDGSTYVKYSGTATGLVAGITYSAANDNLTVDAGKGGNYNISFSGTATYDTAGDYVWGLLINSNPSDDLKSWVYIPTTSAYADFSFSSWSIALSAGDTVALGCFSTNGRIVTVVGCHINITKISN